MLQLLHGQPGGGDRGDGVTAGAAPTEQPRLCGPVAKGEPVHPASATSGHTTSLSRVAAAV